jgi:peptide methionine sulfoxide reductase MsrA
MIKIATLGMGWFWTPAAKFGILEGIKKTRVGYAGGTTLNPTYGNIGDHTETIENFWNPGTSQHPMLLGYESWTYLQRFTLLLVTRTWVEKNFNIFLK